MIYKYKLEEIMQLPKGIQILKVGVQNNEIYIWGIVNSEETEIRHFRVIGTGRDTVGKYLDTVFVGPYVWHIFEVQQ
jgi:hypothetical protein